MVVRGGDRPAQPSVRPVDRLMRPVAAFARNRLAGALLMIGAAVVALVIANSSTAESWAHLLHIKVGLTIGSYELHKTLLHWINDGLMGIFFFLVGLEIKHEVIVGELSSLRKAAMPALAALGGMVLPAALYYAFNRSGAQAAGWGIPMATDIAFALGVLALLGDRVPKGLGTFLTALAIADDIGAVLVIAIFYTKTIALSSLAAAGVLLAAAIVMNRLRVRSAIVYLVIGVGVWLAFLYSGVHATIAALLMAFTIPARTWLDGTELHANLKGHLAELLKVGLPRDNSLNSKEQQHVLDQIGTTIARASAPLTKFEHGLAPLVTFLVLPVFALGNAGVSLGGALGAGLSGVSLGVIAGLMLGKPLGVLVFSLLADKLDLADLPAGVTTRHLVGVGLLAGIGFTMAIFIASLAFASEALVTQAKLGILSASLACGLLGYGWLRWVCPQAKA